MKTVRQNTKERLDLLNQKGLRVYYDKNNTPVIPGDTIKFSDGSEEIVHECGDKDLGIPCNSYQCYPLYQFDSRDYYVILK